MIVVGSVKNALPKFVAFFVACLFVVTGHNKIVGMSIVMNSIVNIKYYMFLLFYIVYISRNRCINIMLIP